MSELISNGEGDEFTPPQMFAREGALDVVDFKETGIDISEVITPTLWNVIIFPKQPRKMSAGGIALPETAQDVERYLNYIGQVVAMGPLAGKSEKFLNPDWVKWREEGGVSGLRSKDANGERDYIPLPVPPQYLWDVKVGDWVTFGKYSGMNFEAKGYRFMNVNDDMITGVIKNPADFRVHV